ncbi:ribokinase [Rosenbergiella collisarenosi]|uniref:ribokinase n=1 Tax=Rosenbergiella collisarenosi TaxID=1544695 RepID=UPI001F4E86F6|nr:ribokinase [Rosenbergiella collisarenosi]
MQVNRKMAVLGSINIDHVLQVPHFPRPGETLTGNHYQQSFGGKGANQAVAAGRSGASITFIARVGNDDIGQVVIQQLSQDNIDISAVEATDDAATGLAMIYLDDRGENTIGIYPGANALLTEEYVQKHQQVIIDSDALLLQLEVPLPSVLAAAQLAKQHDVLTVLNPAPAQPLSNELLALIDIITPNETEAESLTGVAVNTDDDAYRAACVLHSKGIHTVVITLGSRGVWLSIEGQGQRLPGYDVTVKDTIAAGDTFNGAFLCRYLENTDQQEAVSFAQAAAAIAVSRQGAQTSIPWREEITDFLNQ